RLQNPARARREVSPVARGSVCPFSHSGSDLLMLELLESLLDQCNTVCLLRDAFNEGEIRLVFSNRALGIGGFNRVCQIEAGNGISRTEDDSPFKRSQ